MKFVVRDLSLGAILRGKVEEVLDDGDLIISFEGDLLRAQNATRRILKLGDVVTLIVTATDPLRFQLHEENRRKARRGHIDISV